MAARELGRLEKVDLREAWANEAAHFTPWLARPENLALLGETVGIDLELEAQEKGVGPFSADILCRNTLTEDWVLIENQLERTDHTHLGQLITYAAGLNAVTIVWIAQRFTDEHRAALDWLNEHTDDKINAFGLEIELWRIGDSPVAPKFNVICQPNDWSRSVQKVAAETGTLSEQRRTQLDFWTEFVRYMSDRRSKVRFGAPSPRSSLNSPLGRSGIFICSTIVTWGADLKPEIRADVYFNSRNAKAEFLAFQARSAEVERALGFPLIWQNSESNKSAKASSRLEADFTERSEWPKQFEWLAGRLDTMVRVLPSIVASLPTGARETQGEESE